MTTTAAPVRWRAVFAGRRGRLLAGLMLLEVATGVQSLVVTAILPAITDRLGDRWLYGIALAATTLATFVTIPLAGPYADRVGVRRALVTVVAVLVAGTLVAGLAPTMPVLVAGRLVQGMGSGALNVVTLTGIAGVFPARLRPRVLALTSAAWIVPGLFGPAYGAVLAQFVGWRVPILSYLVFLLVAVALALPPLARLAPPTAGAAGLPVPAALALFAGAVLVTVGAGRGGLVGWGGAALGVLAGGVALRRLLPTGTWTLRRGLPATVAAAFLLTAGYFALPALVPVLLTAGLRTDLRTASLAVTAGALTWSLGSWLHARAADAGRAPTRIAAYGGLLLAAAALTVLLGLRMATPPLLYAGCLAAGLGMGLGYPALWLATMGAGTGGATSATLLADVLGTGLGAGLAGTAAAAGVSRHALVPALTGTLVAVAVLALGFAVVARRMSDPGRRVPSAEEDG
ncbi:MAG TPA: MFS transporter [Actinocatenispora sp.]